METQEHLYLDKKLMLVEHARRWIGTKEKGGPNKGPEVEMFQRTVDGKAQGESWCAAFVWFCIDSVTKGYTSVHGSDAFPSWLFRSEHVLTLWNNSTKAARDPVPAVGNLMVWQFWEQGKQTTKGHVGIVSEVMANGYVKTIEGNTGAGPGVVREGDGVYERVRKVAGNDTMKVKGFLDPWDRDWSVRGTV